MSTSIKVQQENSVCKIWLNRPDKLNSFNQAMAFAFQQVLDECEQDSEVRCIWISGAGRAFCAGQDLAEVVDENGPELQGIVAEHYNPIIERIRNIEKPIVAFVNGVAAGAGANIALACDVVVAKKSASFIQAFSKIGLIPDSGGTFSLPRLIGWQKASALMMLGDKVGAEEAERLGMIYNFFEDEKAEAESEKIALKLAMMPTKGLGYTKRALNQSLTNDLTQQLAVEEELQTKSSKTYDYKEGVEAFLEKRKPNFKGE